jgi:hypothetical protein
MLGLGINTQNLVGGSTAFSNQNSISFDGTNEYIELSSSVLLGDAGTGDWSISFWMNADNISTGANQRLWSFGAGGTLQTQMYITGGGTLQFGGPWSDGFGFGASSGTWYHIIYRVNTASSSLNVGYVLNGSIYNKKSQNVTTTFDTTGSSYLGRNSGAYGFSGNLDEVSVWNKYLSDTDCIEIYNGGTPNDLSTVAAAVNLQHWWRMGDGDTFPTIIDHASNNDGAMNNMLSSNITTETP